MKDKIKVTYFNNEVLEVPVNSRILDVYDLISEKTNRTIIGVKVDGEIVDMFTKLKKDTYLDFFDTNTIDGYKIYQAGLKFVLEVSLNKVFGDNIEITFNHSIMRGIHVRVISDKVITDEDVVTIKKEMDRIINSNVEIQKMIVLKKEAYSYYEKTNNLEKAYNIHNEINEFVTLYKLENKINYFYIEMPPRTKILNKYDLVNLDNNELVLLFPTLEKADSVPPYVHYEKVIDVFRQEKAWLVNLGVPFVYQINKKVMNGNITDLIRLSETNYDNKLYDIAKKIIAKHSKYVMLSGPSSSGKTTTTKKLALTLESLGIKTLTISVDDYFKNREDSPRNPDGSYNFECLEAIDTPKLNVDLKALANGEEVILPIYNFKAGKREYHKKPTKLIKGTIILMEGLHCLNDKLTFDIPKEDKYLIYLSPFMPVNIDRHNYISTTDLRLIRRMIRDNRTRGYDVSKTIDYWQSVRNGEEKYIFPYLDRADIIINTALVYELGVLKVFAEPILYSVPNDSPYYEEARRLIKFLNSYFPITSEYVSNNSVLREFIGGSIFEEEK